MTHPLYEALRSSGVESAREAGRTTPMNIDRFAVAAAKDYFAERGACRDRGAWCAAVRTQLHKLPSEWITAIGTAVAAGRGGAIADQLQAAAGTTVRPLLIALWAAGAESVDLSEEQEAA